MSVLRRLSYLCDGYGEDGLDISGSLVGHLGKLSNKSYLAVLVALL